MLDAKAGSDHHLLAHLVQLPEGVQIIQRMLDPRAHLTVIEPESCFDLRRLATESAILALLYYWGYLTLSSSLSEMGELVLRVPNLLTQQYLESCSTLSMSYK